MNPPSISMVPSSKCVCVCVFAVPDGFKRRAYLVIKSKNPRAGDVMSVSLSCRLPRPLGRGTVSHTCSTARRNCDCIYSRSSSSLCPERDSNTRSHSHHIRHITSTTSTHREQPALRLSKLLIPTVTPEIPVEGKKHLG